MAQPNLQELTVGGIPVPHNTLWGENFFKRCLSRSNSVIRTNIMNKVDLYMNRIKIETLFLVVCLAVFVLGCGDTEDAPVDPVGPDDELGLMYDDPADAGRPVPSFQ